MSSSRWSGVPAGFPDYGNLPVQMARRLTVDGNPIGAGFEKPGNDGIRAIHHQMHIQWQPRFLFEGGNELGAEGQIGNEMTVHNIDMDQVGPGLFDDLDGLGNPGEVCR